MIDVPLAFVEILIAGGWLIVPILICSFVAFAIMLERIWYFRRMSGIKDADQMVTLVAQGKFTEALSLNDGNSHPVLRVLAAGILARDFMPDKAMEVAGIVEITHMKRGLPAMDTVITLAPLLGLLGTIVGMIDSFGIMAIQGIGQPHAVTGGVAEALICTAAGIFVAVMTLIPYNYFLTRTEIVTDSIERYATQTERALQEATAGLPS